MRRCKPTSVGDLWARFVSENPKVSESLSEARVPEIWPSVVGSAMASLTESVAVKNGILHVKVSSSVARHELFMRREDLRRQINATMGKAVIKSVIVK